MKRPPAFRLALGRLATGRLAAFRLAAGLLAAGLALAAPTAAQVIEGRVTGDDGVPVDGALVGLYDEEGTQRAATLADEEGFYRLEAPEPGEYVLGAERIGFSPFRSHLLAVGDRAEAYQVDLEMLRAPVPIEGITVTAERLEAARRQIRLLIGVDPKSLRVDPILRDEIIANWERGRDIPAMLQWASLPGLTVIPQGDSYCFEIRGDCTPVFLNGMQMNPAWSHNIPLEVVESVVILGRNESIQYPIGGILLFTEAWMR